MVISCLFILFFTPKIKKVAKGIKNGLTLQKSVDMIFFSFEKKNWSFTNKEI